MMKEMEKKRRFGIDKGERIWKRKKMFGYIAGITNI